MLLMQQIELISARITFTPNNEFYKSQLAFYIHFSHDSSKISVPSLTDIMIRELALHFKPSSITNEPSTEHDHYSIKMSSPKRNTFHFPLSSQKMLSSKYIYILCKSAWLFTCLHTVKLFCPQNPSFPIQRYFSDALMHLVLFMLMGSMPHISKFT
jgi:hypothetical protein